jgi:hypothetical protein
MDEQIVERIIRKLSTGFSYRFPSECYRCGRKFEPQMISCIERGVTKGKTIMETVVNMRYDKLYNEYLNPGETGYSSSIPPAIGPKDICCRLCIISPYVYPTGTIVSHKTEKRVIGVTTKTELDPLDLFDYVEDQDSRPELVVDDEHGDIRLYIEDGIPGFEPPIEWEDME